MQPAISIDYVAEPTPAKFHASDALVRTLIGPIGSGKSATCVAEIFSRSIAQQAGDDGVRRSRWGVIRNTYAELKTTTIKTFLDWFPESICKIRYDAPITARVKIPLSSEDSLDLEVLFVSADKQTDVKKLLSLELTGLWLNETRELPKAILDMGIGRVGRYPAKRMGGPTFSGVICDTNPPDDDHWMYKLEADNIPGYVFFHQPPALLRNGKGYISNPNAENVRHQPLGAEYWLRQYPGKTEDWIKVYLLGEYGTLEDGRPVYPEFAESVHVSRETLRPDKAEPLIVSFDFGLTPSAVIQQCIGGQLRTLRELVATDMGIKGFATDVLKPYLSMQFNGYSVAYPGDPAGVQRAQTDERTVFDVLREVGIIGQPASTNNFLARREAVSGFLTKMVHGKPGYVIDPSCKTLIKGFKGGYKYRRLQVVGEDRYTEKPDKNRFSHPHDALQYGALYAGGHRPDDKHLKPLPRRKTNADGFYF